MGLHNKEYGMLRSVRFFLCSLLGMDSIHLGDGEWHSFLENEFEEE